MNNSIDQLNKISRFKKLHLLEIVNSLKTVEGIEAIALTGSYVQGMAKRNSDVDLILFYSEKAPPIIKNILEKTSQLSLTQCSIADFYELGPWYNAGCKLLTEAGYFDCRFCNIDQMKRVLKDAFSGCFVKDHTYLSATYLAYVYYCIPLYDPKEIAKDFNQSVQIYPEALRKAIVLKLLENIRFLLMKAQHQDAHECIYRAFGLVHEIVRDFTQVLFSLNHTYYLSDKRMFTIAKEFTIKPDCYCERIKKILSRPGNGRHLLKTLNELRNMLQEFTTLVLMHL